MNRVCKQGSCAAAACQMPTNHTYFVNAVDAGSQGATGSPMCPFPKLRRALNVISSRGENTTDDVTIVLASDLTEANQGTGVFPITVPGRITIRGDSPAPRRRVTTPVDTSAFHFSSTAPGGLHALELRSTRSGTGQNVGVLVEDTYDNDLTPARAVSLRNLDVQGFVWGIEVGTDGFIWIQEDVSSTRNGEGLGVFGGYGIARHGPGAAPCHFDDNESTGIDVDYEGVLDLLGVDGGINGLSITASRNGEMGIVNFSDRPQVADGAGGLVANRVTRVAVNDNVDYGFFVNAQSKLKVRSCEIGNNRIGVLVAGEVLSDFDFGRPSDPGLNVLSGYSRGLWPFGYGSTESMVNASGNTWNGQVCSAPNPSYTLTWSDSCSSPVAPKDICFGGGHDYRNWSINVANCTPGDW
jgi:hypothetical protein